MCVWMFELCASLIFMPHTTDLIGLLSNEIRSMHTNVLNMGDGSQSRFHMNNDDENHTCPHLQ